MHKSFLSSLKQGLRGKGVWATLREGWEGCIHQDTSSESLTTDQRFPDQQCLKCAQQHELIPSLNFVLHHLTAQVWLTIKISSNLQSEKRITIIS